MISYEPALNVSILESFATFSEKKTINCLRQSCAAKGKGRVTFPATTLF